ncbi:cupin domain-containing protein [Candidatus Fermentibacteria bacterium]|nr:cupin domain-containing protein [Candidatus Fermentibacteria bacterium]
MAPHAEGGYFAETYRAELTIPHQVLPGHYAGARRACTAIYFLLDGEDFSAFHRLQSDEIWHFYSGEGLDLYVMDDERGLGIHHLGNSLDPGRVPQATVPAGSWLAARPSDPDSYALVGCTVAPGFEFADFELGDRAALVARYPAHRELIASFTRVRPLQ